MILLISGPSGAGKSSVYRELMRRDPRLGFSVSTTTRPIRTGERDGIDYHFVSDEQFDRLLAAEAFLEWAQVHGHRYGTRRDHVRQMESAGLIPLLDIDVQGGVQVLDSLGGDIVAVFLFPPSWTELERRLRGRETDTDEVIATRLKNARWEITFADRYTYWLVNDGVAATVDILQAILLAETHRRERFDTPPLSPD